MLMYVERGKRDKFVRLACVGKSEPERMQHAPTRRKIDADLSQPTPTTKTFTHSIHSHTKYTYKHVHIGSEGGLALSAVGALRLLPS